MPTEILVIGAGGHAKVVIEAIQDGHPSYHIKLADHDRAKEGNKVLGKFPIIHLNNWVKLPEFCHVAIGDNQLRQKVHAEAVAQGKQTCTVVHSDARVSPSADIGPGCFVAAKAIVAAEAKIGESCIINHGAVVDHDCNIGNYSHIAPNATLGGGVNIGQGCLVGTNATILPNVKVGDNSVIGAGAVVINDVKANQRLIGVPARCVNSDE